MALRKWEAGEDEGQHDRQAKAVKRAPRRKIVQAPRAGRMTRAVTTNASIMAVLGTTELLESILLLLPMRTVFGLQRVCRLFGNIVRDSKVIQQHLFLLANRPETHQAQAIARNPTNEISFNQSALNLPLNLAAVFEGRAVRLVNAQTVDKKVAEDKLRKPAQLNPLLWLPNASNNPTASSADAANGSKCERAMLRGSLPFELHLRRRGSWDRTLLTIPPCTSAIMHLYWNIDSEPAASGLVKTRVNAKEGVTLGMLLDSVVTSVRFNNYESENWAWNGQICLEEVLDELEHQSGKKAKIRTSESWIDLHGIIVPIEAEWWAVE